MYFDAKAKLIQKYAKKYDSDGEEKDEKGNIIKSWKKGDFILDNGNVFFEDIDTYLFEFKELLDIEIEISCKQVSLNDLDCTFSVEEMQVLAILIKEE